MYPAAWRVRTRLCAQPSPPSPKSHQGTSELLVGNKATTLGKESLTQTLSVTKHFYFAVTGGGKLGHSIRSLVSTTTSPLVFYSHRFKGFITSSATCFLFSKVAGAEDQWMEAIKKLHWFSIFKILSPLSLGYDNMHSKSSP